MAHVHNEPRPAAWAGKNESPEGEPSSHVHLDVGRVQRRGTDVPEGAVTTHGRYATAGQCKEERGRLRERADSQACAAVLTLQQECWGN
jgi:hypothetical protein